MNPSGRWPVDGHDGEAKAAEATFQDDPERVNSLVKEAIRGLPASLTADYDTAVLTAPEIVASETNALKFWRCEHGNAWAAGLRLANNWSFRRKVFGEEGWLRPTRIKDGSMQPEDVALLRTGAFSLRTPTDPTYRQTTVFDFGRVGQATGSRHRGMFYYMVSDLNAFTQWHGIDGIIVISGDGMKMKPDNGTLINASNNSLMANIHKIALVCDPNDKRTTLTHLFSVMMMKLIKTFYSGKLVTIVETTPEATRDALVAEGFHPSTIPKELGGDVSMEDFANAWILGRLRLEMSTESTGTTAITGEIQPTATVAAAPLKRHTKTANHPVGPKANFPSAEAVRTFAVAAAVEEDISRSSSTKQQPKRSAASASLVADAAGHSNPPEPEDNSIQQIRERNAEYSRSFYYRSKKAKNALQEKHDTLVQDNARLRDDEQRLLFLLREAQRAVIVHTYAQVGVPGYHQS